VNNKSSKIKEVITELTEQKNFNSLRHYWSIAISDLKILIFKIDDYYESGTGITGAVMATTDHIYRLEDADRLVGDDMERIIAKMRTKYIFSREPGTHLKFKVVKKWWGARKLLLEDDTKMVEKEMGYKPNIYIWSKQIKELQEAVPELEIEYVKE
jgi:hypothetical protein